MFAKPRTIFYISKYSGKFVSDALRCSLSSVLYVTANYIQIMRHSPNMFCYAEA